MKTACRLFLVGLLFCSGCAPEAQKYSPYLQPPALQARASIAQLITQDNVALPVRAWVPRGEPDAIIVALHGFNDYSHAFEIPGEYLQLHHIALYAYDQRGFGHALNKGKWAGEDNLARDAKDMIEAVHKRYPGTPVYLLGESMGGAVAIAAAIRPDFPTVDGLILSAPAVWGGETLNPLYRASLWAFAHTYPQKKLTGEDLHILASDNIEMLRALGGDPYVIKATRVDAIYGLVQLMDTAYSGIGKVQVPMLILYGAHDQVIPPRAIVKSVHHMNAWSRLAYYPLGYHMLLRDKHGDVPLKDVIAWIENKQAPLPSGYDSSGKSFLQERWLSYNPRHY